MWASRVNTGQDNSAAVAQNKYFAARVTVGASDRYEPRSGSRYPNNTSRAFAFVPSSDFFQF